MTLWDVILLLAALGVFTYLVRRSFRGPQKVFSRLAVAFLLCGTLCFFFVGQQNDLFSVVGSLLFIAGILVALLMEVVEFCWDWRRDKRGPDQ